MNEIYLNITLSLTHADMHSHTTLTPPPRRTHSDTWVCTRTSAQLECRENLNTPSTHTCTLAHERSHTPQAH